MFVSTPYFFLLSFMEIIWFLLIGLVAGWIAGQIVRGGGFGVIGDIVIGIAGSFIGGFVFRLLGISAYGTLGSIVMAVVGAIVFIFLLRALRRT